MNLLNFLKEQNPIFFDALGEEHTIDGVKLQVIVDVDALKDREDRNGLAMGDLMYFARPEDFLRPLHVDDVQVFDGRRMTISEVSEQTGMLRVVLAQTMSR